MADKRYSIITNQLDFCMKCGKPGAHKHEVFFGRNRQLSIEDGMVVPLCYWHHEGNDSPHLNRSIDLSLKKSAQKAWEQKYGSREDFIKRYGKSYL